jgi:hypothetical protein
MVRVEELPPGWLTRFRRGVVCGAATVGIACLIAAVPTLLAWFAPGADSTSAMSAVKIAVLLALSANRGGLVLDGTLVTLTPLLATAILAAMVAAQARKPESGGAFAGFVLGYTATCGIASRWAVVGSTRTEALPTMLAALVLSVGVGVAARWGPAAWRKIGSPWRAVGRASLAATAVYLLAAAALDAAMLVVHFSAAVRMQSELAVGAAGLPVAVIGLAGLPNAVVATTGYLAGPGFSVGTHTHVSLAAVHRGDLPVFPVLAGLPSAGAQRDLGIALSVITALTAGAVIARIVVHSRRLQPSPGWGPAVPTAARGDAMGARLARLAAASLVTGLCLGLLAAVGGGNLGSDAMHGIGAPVLPLIGAVAVALAVSSTIAYLCSAVALRVLRGGVANATNPVGADTAATDPADDVTVAADPAEDDPADDVTVAADPAEDDPADDVTVAADPAEDDPADDDTVAAAPADDGAEEAGSEPAAADAQQDVPELRQTG